MLDLWTNHQRDRFFSSHLFFGGEVPGVPGSEYQLLLGIRSVYCFLLGNGLLSVCVCVFFPK